MNEELDLSREKIEKVKNRVEEVVAEELGIDDEVTLEQPAIDGGTVKHNISGVSISVYAGMDDNQEAGYCSESFKLETLRGFIQDGEVEVV